MDFVTTTYGFIAHTYCFYAYALVVNRFGNVRTYFRE